MKAVSRVFRGLSGRAYEGALRLGLARYRKPWSYSQNLQYWDQGYAHGQHDHYADLSDCPRYGVLASYLSALPGRLHVVDIGCGQGLLRTYIPDQKIASYVGLDQSASAIRQAEQREFPATRFEVATLPREIGWDVAICNEMLYYLDDVDVFLSEVRRFVRPGGLLLVSMTRFHGDFVIWRKLSGQLDLADSCMVINRAEREKWRLACYTVSGRS